MNKYLLKQFNVHKCVNKHGELSLFRYKHTLSNFNVNSTSNAVYQNVRMPRFSFGVPHWARAPRAVQCVHTRFKVCEWRCNNVKSKIA